LVKLPKLKTPFSADLERPTNVRAKVVIAAALAGQVEPRAGDVHGSRVAEISRLGLGWRRVQAMKVSLGVVTANGIQDAFPQIEKKRRPSYRQAAHAASIAREFGRHFASVAK
jgi:hypothetical protein